MGVGSPQAGPGTRHAGPKVSLPLLQAYFVHAASVDQTTAASAADAAAAEPATFAAAAAAIHADAGFDLAPAVDTHIEVLLVLLQLHLVDSTSAIPILAAAAGKTHLEASHPESIGGLLPAAWMHHL